ncbi:MAG: DNA primase [Candidatus Paceibacterota bacterium]
MSDLEEIKNRLDIVDVVSKYIKLEKAGANFRACCPFHDEKTPSFMVSPSKQIWHCFGCSLGGDIFQFVMKIEGIEFKDALKILAKEAGVELKTFSKTSFKEKTERQKIAETLNQALKFFEHYLNNSKKGVRAKEYLIKKRGFTEDLIKEWRIGYAPDSYEMLSKFLESRGYNKMFIEKAGLAFLKSNGGLCDRFRSRIVFPFFNINSELIGFTGRIFEKEEDLAKYLNTPSTVLYDKSRVLFGLDKAKIEIRKKDKCILVEGNIDCIMAHNAGSKNVVAVSGTALTDNHLKIIKRYTANLVFAFDMDSAGAKATERAIDLARKMDFNVSVLNFSEDKDPADVILNQGADKWNELIEKAEEIMDFYFRKAFLNKDSEKVEDKKKIAQEILVQIKKMNNNIEQAHFIQKLGQKLKVREEDLRKELLKVKLVEEIEKNENEVKKKITQKEKIEKRFLKLYLIKKIKLENIFYLFSKKYKEILEKLDKGEKVLNVINDKNFLSEIILGVEREKELLKENENSVEEELENCVINLKKIFNEKKKKDLSLKIRNETREEIVEELMEEYLSLIKQNYGESK